MISYFQDAIEKTDSKEGGRILRDHPSKTVRFIMLTCLCNIHVTAFLQHKIDIFRLKFFIFFLILLKI